jgi:hypothetical protein
MHKTIEIPGNLQINAVSVLWDEIVYTSIKHIDWNIFKFHCILNCDLTQ